MPSSGLYTFQLPTAGVLFEAFDRIQKRPTEVDRHMLISARASLNLEFIKWENAGFNFWKTTSGTINLVVNQPTYTLPANLVMLTELYYTQVNGDGTGVNQDRIMVPIERTQYAAVVNKLQQGIPTQYWFQMLTVPQITIWEVPFVGAPQYVLNWYGLQQMQDANIANGETPDIPRRAIEALCARMALRLCEKFGPAQPQARQEMMLEKKAIADDAWNDMTRRDQEPGVTTFNPNVSGYARMGSR
jgi:hypothetical protein